MFKGLYPCVAMRLHMFLLWWLFCHATVTLLCASVLLIVGRTGRNNQIVIAYKDIAFYADRFLRNVGIYHTEWSQKVGILYVRSLVHVMLWKEERNIGVFRRSSRVLGFMATEVEGSDRKRVVSSVCFSNNRMEYDHSYTLLLASVKFIRLIYSHGSNDEKLRFTARK